MELTLEPEEHELLRSVAARHLASLRSEIVRTDRYVTRQELKHEEAVLKALIARLEQPQPVGR